MAATADRVDIERVPGREAPPALVCVWLAERLAAPRGRMAVVGPFRFAHLVPFEESLVLCAEIPGGPVVRVAVLGRLGAWEVHPECGRVDLAGLEFEAAGVHPFDPQGA